MHSAAMTDSTVTARLRRNSSTMATGTRTSRPAPTRSERPPESRPPTSDSAATATVTATAAIATPSSLREARALESAASTAPPCSRALTTRAHPPAGAIMANVNAAVSTSRTTPYREKAEVRATLAHAARLLAGHGDAVPLLRRDQVIGVPGVLAQVDLHPPDAAGEGGLPG